MNLTDLNAELSQLLRDNPELLELQMKISKDLATLDDPLARSAYCFEEMLDKLAELHDNIRGLQAIMENK